MFKGKFQINKRAKNAIRAMNFSLLDMDNKQLVKKARSLWGY